MSTKGLHEELPADLENCTSEAIGAVLAPYRGDPCCLLQQYAARPRKLCPRTLPASVTPATRCQRRPAVGQVRRQGLEPRTRGLRAAAQGHFFENLSHR